MTRHPRPLPLSAVRIALVASAVLALVGAPTATANGIQSRPGSAAVQPDPDVPRVPTVQADPAADAFVASNVNLGLSQIASGLENPVLVTGAGDGSGRLFVVEQTGRVRVIKGGSLLSTPFLDLRSWISTGGERGLLGLAFHPGFPTHPYIYVNFTDVRGNTVIERFTVAPGADTVNTSTAYHILTMSQPYANHNGGNLAFGMDGNLYIGMGDGGSAGDPGNRAQNLSSYMGKLLRIDVDHPSGTRHYRSPSTNPYVGKAGLDEIWARGLRNPWRWSFDRATGTLWVGDVGQGRYEEIDRVYHVGSTPGGRGVNFGWSTMEGRACYKPPSGCSTSGRWTPQIVYPHVVSGQDNCAVTGGFVYRGTAYPVLQGGYVFGDFCSGRIWVVSANAHTPATPFLVRNPSASPHLMISSFGQDDDGELYVCDWQGGRIYKITAVARS
jgi:glucose/arabinose dehydrogenase